MHFAYPSILWIMAVAIPLLAWFLVWSWCKKRSLMAQFVQSRLLAQLTVGVSATRQKIRMGLALLAVSCLLLALAQPQYGFVWEEVKQRGLDIVLAIDTSRSMLTTDVQPNRLTRAKLAAQDLLACSKSDRLGLVAFAGSAFLQCPLTLDEEAFRQSVAALDTSIIPQGGSALSDAIETALSAFKEGDSLKAILILTDGEDHEGGAVEAAEKAAKAGARVYTMGIGTAQGDRIRVVDEKGKTSFLTDESGKQVTSQLNEDLLRKIAQAGQGEYLQLKGANDMAMLYNARLATLPRAEIASRFLQQFKHRFQWPLGLALLLLLVEMLLPEQRRVARPGQKPEAEGWRKAFVTLAVALSIGLAHGSSGSALRDYESGRYRESQQEYQRQLQKSPKDPRLQYNVGTAALRAGDFLQASNHLDSATRSGDPDLLKRTYYNLGNTMYRVGEKAGAPEEMKASWEEAIRHFDSTLQLDPKDEDAKHNREFVAKKLEELQQQQQQQNQDQKDQKQDQDKDQKQQEQNQKKDDKDQKDQQEQSKQDQQKEKEKDPSQQSSKDDPKQSEAQDEKSPPKPDQDGQKSQPQPQPQPKEGKEQPAGEAAAKAGQMTPEQARQLLDMLKADDKMMIFSTPPPSERKARVRREW